jgi:hypothetical protein
VGGGVQFGAREWLEDHYESSEDEAAQEPQHKDNTGQPHRRFHTHTTST